MSSLMPEETMVPWVYAPSLLLLVFFLIKIFYSTTRPSGKINLPPSPPKLPVIGNIHQLGPVLHRSLDYLSKRYGGPLMLMHLGSVQALIVSTAEAAREIMKTQDLTFSTRPEVRRWRQILYDLKEVSVAPYGESWRQYKSIMVLNFLSKSKVESYREVREEEMAIAVDKIKKSCDLKQPVDLSDLFLTLTNDVVCRVTFGKKYSEGESGKKFKKMLKEFWDVLSELNFEDIIPWLGFIDRLRGISTRVVNVAKELDDFLDGLVEERLQKHSIGGAGDVDGREDFLEILLKIQKENSNSVLDRDAIKGLLLDVYTAGTDTTAAVLEWAFAELFKHPKIFKKVQDEVRTVLQDKKQITQQDIDNMPYFKAMIKETLRLHPPAPTLIPRASGQDTKVMGYDVKKGTRVIINGWAIQRDPKVWDEPDEFKPERFLDNSTIDYKGHDFDLIPFGSGRRGCPGMAFAIAIDEHVLANLLHKFDWELPNGETGADLDMEEHPGITIHKKVPLLAVPKQFSS